MYQGLCVSQESEEVLKIDAHVLTVLEDSDELMFFFFQLLFDGSDNTLAIAFALAGECRDVLGKDEKPFACHNFCSRVHLKTMVPEEGIPTVTLNSNLLPFDLK